jgi:hypothetical protein
MHVALRRREILMAGEFLDRFRRCAAHCEMGTKGVAQPVSRQIQAAVRAMAVRNEPVSDPIGLGHLSRLL